MILRFIYFRSSEILTLLIVLLISGYLFNSLTGASRILSHEEKAQQTVWAIYALETKNEPPANKKSFRLLSEIRGRSPLLQELELIPLSQDRSEELYTDRNYLYFFKLITPPKSVDDYMSGQESKDPLGFEILAWPHRFADTGEQAYFLDAQGRLAISTNERAIYNGLKSFPPDLEIPRAVLKPGSQKSKFPNWRVGRFPGKKQG